MSLQTSFFGVGSDLLEGVAEFEDKYRVRYVLCETNSNRTFCEFRQLGQLQSLGFTKAPSYIGGAFYMVLRTETPLVVETIPQRKGGTMYALGQARNPESIILRPGGVYEEGVIIRGSVGTAARQSESEELYRAFRQSMSKRFMKVRGYLVGTRARQLLRERWRFITIHVNEELDYDLKDG